MAEAVLGRDAEEFLATDIGRYIVGRCEQDIAEAQDQLSRVSPWRKKRIQELQNQVWRAQSVRGWIGELVADGGAAEAALEEQG
jgi:hypothetical protein